MIDASAEVGKLITRLSEVQTQRDTARRELREAQAEVARLKLALTDIQNVGARHSDEMVAVGFCVMCAKMALESAAVPEPTSGLLTEDVSGEGEAL